MDDLGLIPEDLDRKLEMWKDTDDSKPCILYPIPTCQHPTGTTRSAERRQKIYHVAVKHYLYILEDDAHFFLLYM